MLSPKDRKTAAKAKIALEKRKDKAKKDAGKPTPAYRSQKQIAADLTPRKKAPAKKAPTKKKTGPTKAHIGMTKKQREADLHDVNNAPKNRVAAAQARGAKAPAGSKQAKKAQKDIRDVWKKESFDSAMNSGPQKARELRGLVKSADDDRKFRKVTAKKMVDNGRESIARRKKNGQSVAKDW